MSTATITQSGSAPALRIFNGNNPLSVLTSPKQRFIHEKLGKLLIRQINFTASSRVNHAYEKIVFFADDIAKHGHTDGSANMLKDLIADYKEAAKGYALIFNNPSERSRLKIDDDKARKISDSYQNMNQQLKLLISEIKTILLTKPEPEHKELPMPAHARGFDARRLETYKLAPVHNDLVLTCMTEKIRLEQLKKANNALDKAIEAAADFSKSTSRSIGEGIGKKMARFFGFHARKMDKLIEERQACYERVKKAEAEYTKILEANSKSIYEKYYGMKITNSSAMPQAALRFMRPLSSEEKDLTHQSLISKIQAAESFISNPQIEAEYLHGSRQLHLRRTNTDGSITTLKISPTIHPGRSIIEFDGVKVASGWNDKIAVIAERFIKGKNLKYTVRDSNSVSPADLVFKPVSSKLEKFCLSRGYTD